ncbi:MAG: hypothetical protein IPG45_07320 [Deltaproteobacteria bacterium]|jgi:hypothetical protein|nr:hypothetical protein [Deltaproteobacteria bacterium]
MKYPRARAVWAAAAEAAFPEGTSGPSHRDAQVSERFWEWHDALPPGSARLIHLLLWTIDLFALVRTGRPFTWLPPERRLQLLSALRASRFYPIRLVGESMKGLLTMTLLSSPAVMRHVGVYSVDAHPADPYQLPIKRDALRVLDEREVA